MQHSLYHIFLKKFCYLFIFGCAGSSLLCEGLSLVAASRGYSLVVVCGLLIFSSCRAQATKFMGFSNSSSWPIEGKLSSCGAWV